MPGVEFRRVRAEVRELWSAEPISEAALVQGAAEQANNREEDAPYPTVRGVDPAKGMWELFRLKIYG